MLSCARVRNKKFATVLRVVASQPLGKGNMSSLRRFSWWKILVKPLCILFESPPFITRLAAAGQGIERSWSSPDLWSEIRTLPQRGSTEHGLYFLYVFAAQDAVFFRVGVWFCIQRDLLNLYGASERFDRTWTLCYVCTRCPQNGVLCFTTV